MLWDTNQVFVLTYKFGVNIPNIFNSQWMPTIAMTDDRASLHPGRFTCQSQSLPCLSHLDERGKTPLLTRPFELSPLNNLWRLIKGKNHVSLVDNDLMSQRTSSIKSLTKTLDQTDVALTDTYGYVTALYYACSYRIWSPSDMTEG